MDIFHALTQRQVYRDFFGELRKKAACDKHRLSSKPGSSSISLAWTLENEDLITDTLSSAIADRTFRFTPAVKGTVVVDKPRVVYGLRWPERILEGCLAKLLTDELDPHLSNNLYSFRKGRGNFVALRQLSAYLGSSQSIGHSIFAVKRDIASFGDNVPKGPLIERLLPYICDQHPFIKDLLLSALSPLYVEMGESATRRLDVGLPTGFALSTVMVNLYLSEIDRELERISDSFYARLGDDILFLHHNQQTAHEARLRLEEKIQQLGLTVKAEKASDVQLSPDHSMQHSSSPAFKSSTYIEYLGFSISRSGALFLNRRKLRILKNSIRRLISYTSHSTRRSHDGDALAALITVANRSIQNGLSHPYLKTLLHLPLLDTERLRQLDTWIAQQVLAPIYGTSHARVFRSFPLRELRKRGLNSLVDRHQRRFRASAP